MVAPALLMDTSPVSVFPALHLHPLGSDTMDLLRALQMLEEMLEETLTLIWGLLVLLTQRYILV